jgi:hypothetical protein
LIEGRGWWLEVGVRECKQGAKDGSDRDIKKQENKVQQ